MHLLFRRSIVRCMIILVWLLEASIGIAEGCGTSRPFSFFNFFLNHCLEVLLKLCFGEKVLGLARQMTFLQGPVEDRIICRLRWERSKIDL